MERQRCTESVSRRKNVLGVGGKEGRKERVQGKTGRGDGE
jgi:hypothetical protein